jgi:hypothetical protein
MSDLDNVVQQEAGKSGRRRGLLGRISDFFDHVLPDDEGLESTSEKVTPTTTTLHLTGDFLKYPLDVRIEYECGNCGKKRKTVEKRIEEDDESLRINPICGDCHTVNAINQSLEIPKARGRDAIYTASMDWDDEHTNFSVSYGCGHCGEEAKTPEVTVRIGEWLKLTPICPSCNGVNTIPECRAKYKG